MMYYLKVNGEIVRSTSCLKEAMSFFELPDIDLFHDDVSVEVTKEGEVF